MHTSLVHTGTVFYKSGIKTFSLYDIEEFLKNPFFKEEY